MPAFLEPFAAFDPLTGEPPGYGTARFRDVIGRARALLGSWDRAAIERAVDLMDWLFEEQRGAVAAAAETELTALAAAIAEEPDAGDALSAPLATEARELFALIGDRPPPTLNDLPDATWSRLFAVAALAYVGESCARITTCQAHGAPHRPVPTDDALYWTEAFEGLANAVEALGFAERLTTVPPATPSDGLAFWQRQGAAYAAIRHRGGNSLKRRFIEFYRAGIGAGRFRSKAAASRQFQATLSPEEKEPFKHLDRMLLDGLRSELRGTRAPGAAVRPDD